MIHFSSSVQGQENTTRSDSAGHFSAQFLVEAEPRRGHGEEALFTLRR